MPFGNPFGYASKPRVDQFGKSMLATTGPGDGMAPGRSGGLSGVPLSGQGELSPIGDMQEFFRRNRSRAARVAGAAAGGLSGLPSFLRTGTPFGASSSRSYF